MCALQVINTHLRSSHNREQKPTRGDDTKQTTHMFMKSECSHSLFPSYPCLSHWDTFCTVLSHRDLPQGRINEFDSYWLNYTQSRNTAAPASKFHPMHESKLLATELRTRPTTTSALPRAPFISGFPQLAVWPCVNSSLCFHSAAQSNPQEAEPQNSLLALTHLRACAYKSPKLCVSLYKPVLN